MELVSGVNFVSVGCEMRIWDCDSSSFGFLGRLIWGKDSIQDCDVGSTRRRTLAAKVEILSE